MTVTAPFLVTPRQDGDPVADVLGMRLAHRIMLRDARRLTDLAEELAAGSVRPDAKRTRRSPRTCATGGTRCTTTTRSRTRSSGRCWSSPPARTSTCPSSATTTPRSPRCSTGCTPPPTGTPPGREDTATAMALALAELRDTLTEHIGEEEAAVFPVIERYVSVRDWDEVEKRIQRRSKISFELPRVVGAITPEEWPAVAERAGLALRVAIAVLGPPYRRRERAVFG